VHPPDRPDRPAGSDGPDATPPLDLGTPGTPHADEPSRGSTAPASTHLAAHLAKGDRRPPDTLWRANPREQGLLGLTDAIRWFGAAGWSISLPLIDSQPYDLVVDDGVGLHRVQVKTTTRRSRSGRFLVQVCTRGGNRSFQTTKSFDPGSCDLLYVLTDARDRYLIPTDQVGARHTLTLGDRLAPFLLPCTPAG
jgi:hypothetical protein